MADIAATNWNQTDASNTDAAPDGMPEGMAPSGVNNWGRAVQGAVKRWYAWTIPATTGGTSTAYTLTYSVAPGALVDGMTHLVQFNAANGTAPTLNINSLGATPLHYYSAGAWRAVPTGLIGADQVFRVAYNSSAGAYRIMRPRDDTGELVPYAGATAPAGTLLCYGQAISRTDYVGLFTALGTAHGVGNGTTTFNLPDLRGRAVAGKDDMGGAAASRITAGTSGITGTTLGAAGGDERLHNHVHTIPGAAATGFGVASDTGFGFAVGSGTNSGATGGGNSQNVQPTLIINYAVRI